MNECWLLGEGLETTIEELSPKNRICKWITTPHTKCRGNTQQSWGTEGRVTGSLEELGKACPAKKVNLALDFEKGVKVCHK